MNASRGSQWEDCCQHEEEIRLLQDKLKQMHGRLIDQLDVCREQELTIIELNKTIIETANCQNMASFPNQSFGNCNERDTYEKHPYDSYQSQQNKNELLQADLEAMRSRVLEEITEKNRLRQEMEEMEKKYKRELAQQVKKFQGLEIIYKKIQADVRGGQREPRPEDTRAKLDQIQSKYQKEREKNAELQAEKKEMLRKIRESEAKVLADDRQDDSFQFQRAQRVQRDNKYAKHEQSEKENRKDSNLNQQMRQITSLKLQIGKLNQNIEQRDYQFRDRGDGKKKDLQQTKEFIRKLQESENTMRMYRR